MDLMTEGDRSGQVADLLPAVYTELRQVADRLMRRERREHTLQPTALVHEAYLKLARQDRFRWHDREHFVAIAARAMRQVLVNHAESRGAQKRGSGWQRVDLDRWMVLFEERSTDVLALDEALIRLSEIDESAAEVVEVRFFGGLTMEETARVLGRSKRSIERDWAFARAWLRRELCADQ